MNTIKTALAFTVILEVVALGAFEWPGMRHAHAAQATEASRVAADARSTPMADQTEYAPCGILGEAYACPP